MISHQAMRFVLAPRRRPIAELLPELKSEGNSGARSPVSLSEPENDLQTRRVELRSKSLHDPANILVPFMPSPPPTQTIKQVPSVPPIQAPPPRSLNRLKAAGLRTILEEKRLSKDSVVDKYLKMWNTIKFHKFEIFTKPRGSYIPSWVREFYVVYDKLVPKGKKKASAFTLVDHVVVRGRRVKCRNTDINEVLGCTVNVIHFLVDQIQKKTLDDLKGYLDPLI
uniref:Putative plant transposon protein domain-containing protein n=1 Tax=Solanum tuberosum TaxID=4113 RepID=M1DB07_SOLTU